MTATPADTVGHTPGPWSLQPCSHGGLILVRGDPIGHPQHMLQIVPEVDANLIFAAPDLQEAIKPLAFSDENNPPPGVEQGDWSAAVLAARAALAKSRGASR